MVGFSFNGLPLGLMNVRNPPPTGTESHFAESGKAFIKKRYGVEDVGYGEPTNSKSHAYHRFAAEISAGGMNPFEGHSNADPKGYTVLMVVFFDKRTSGTEAQKILREMYGTFQFEFVIPNSDLAVISAEVESLIDSFELPESTTAEQVDAVQPATAPDSKSEGKEKPEPESEERSQ